MMRPAWGPERLSWMRVQLQQRIERTCRRLDMRLVSSARLPMDRVLARYTSLARAGWAGAGPPSAGPPSPRELEDGTREVLFLEQRGCVVAMSSVVRERVADGMRCAVRNTVSLPMGAALLRDDGHAGSTSPVTGKYLGGGALTLYGLIVRALERAAAGDGGGIHWVDASARLSTIPGLEGAERSIQRGFEDCGLELFSMPTVSSYYGSERQFVADAHLVTGIEPVDPRAPLYLPRTASLQAAIVRATFERAYGWTPRVIDEPGSGSDDGLREEFQVQDFSATAGKVCVSSPNMLERLHRQLSVSMGQRPRRVVVIDVANHPGNIPLMAAIESWGCVPLGCLPRWHGPQHRLCWGLLHPDEGRRLPALNLTPRLAESPLGPLCQAVVQRWRACEPADSLVISGA